MTEKGKTSGRPGRRKNPAHETITRKLQELYDSVKEEAIPEHFLDLLERLDAADAAYAKNRSTREHGV